MKASMNGHAGIVKMLVDSGAALYLPDKVHTYDSTQTFLSAVLI